MLPDEVLEALCPQPRIVEVGVGGRFDLLEALAQRLPGARLVAVDIDPERLQGVPSAIEAHVDDVHEPRILLYRAADLIVARRPPVELQPAVARLARSTGAALALRALKDEWADLTGILGFGTLLGEQEAWRWWPRESSRR